MMGPCTILSPRAVLMICSSVLSISIPASCYSSVHIERSIAFGCSPATLLIQPKNAGLYKISIQNDKRARDTSAYRKLALHIIRSKLASMTWVMISSRYAVSEFTSKGEFDVAEISYCENTFMNEGKHDRPMKLPMLKTIQSISDQVAQSYVAHCPIGI